MSSATAEIRLKRSLEQVLGYLNFSSGAEDSQFLANLSNCYQHLGVAPELSPREASGPEAKETTDASTRDDRTAATPGWRCVLNALRQRLIDLQDETSTFANVEQAEAVLALARDHVVPGYLDFHRDLLFHQSESFLVQPYFLGRVFEAILAAGPNLEEPERITETVIGELNDYIGYRPVATLESQKHEPYEKEFCRPVPIFVRGAGTSCGDFREVIDLGIELVRGTDPALLRDACLDPDRMAELAIDPRAYDFDHPVNKRPNYHFGQWDPDHIDNQGYYYRFVIQQVALEALLSRPLEDDELPADELKFEAAAVLAGILLMASGMSGDRPEAHDSSTTLPGLLSRIAAFRDRFYEELIQRVRGAHRRRLDQEAAQLRQPFGGARQHLNSYLARRRASQLQHVHLARVFARMGYPEAAQRKAEAVPAVSARMMCRIECELTAAHQEVDRGNLDHAEHRANAIIDTLHRGIACGAIIDPWNILGFDAQFSLFPSLESSIHDHRADELITLVERLFTLLSRIWGEAAATNDEAGAGRIAACYEGLARWWHQFAAHEVASVEAADALKSVEAARHVAESLHLWHEGGASAGDIGFWAEHTERFDSPRAYALVVEALLDREDLVGSMALLVRWLENEDRIGLEEGRHRFSRLARRWMTLLLRRRDDNAVPADDAGASARAAPPIKQDTWRLARKFLDYLEANAGSSWSVPAFDPSQAAEPSAGTAEELFAGDHFDEDFGDTEEDEENPFEAAWEGVVYRDSTADGIEGEVFDPGDTGDASLEWEAKRIHIRLSFINGVAKLWKMAAVASLGLSQQLEAAGREHREVLANWCRQAAVNREALLRLAQQVHRHRLDHSSIDPIAMVEYDHQRVVKETLLDRIISVTVETSEAIRYLLAAMPEEEVETLLPSTLGDLTDDLASAVTVYAAVFRGDALKLRQEMAHLLLALERHPLVYVPLARGGSPKEMVPARSRHRLIRDLSAWLPRLGLLTETCRLIEVARKMERDRPVGPHAVTEFDDLFEIAFGAIVSQMVAAARHDDRRIATKKRTEQERASTLVNCLEQATQSLLLTWLAHSRTLRLSVLERISSDKAFDKVVRFVDSYGGDLFTQQFLNLGNVRAILHQGVDEWMTHLEEIGDEDDLPKIIRQTSAAEGSIKGRIKRADAVELLSLILEAVVENYGEYLDYNSTTTQSDRGELLYCLLDFLRLRNSYDRVAWNLRPVVQAHEILVRLGEPVAARMWRRAITQRMGEEAEKFVTRLTGMQKKYAMRMPTVADRIQERFIQPMTVDRIRALVTPAMRDALKPGGCAAFELLEHHTGMLIQHPSGAGYDLPAWLEALEDEVEQGKELHATFDGPEQIAQLLPAIEMTLDQVLDQVEQWDELGEGD